MAVEPSPGNHWRVCSEEWWHYEVKARAEAFARAAAEQGARGEFGVHDDNMTPPEGGLMERSDLTGGFRLVTCRRPDWLTVYPVRWEEERAGLWQFGESVAVSGPDGEASPGLFAKLDTLLNRAVNRLASEADGLTCHARVGWLIRAGTLTVCLRIDGLGANPEEVPDAHG
mgnify:CR=1 FL=1